MRFDPNKYRNTLKHMDSFLRSSEDLKATCSRLSVASHAPILAVMLYAKKILNTSELDQDIEKLKVFYRYTTVEALSE